MRGCRNKCSNCGKCLNATKTFRKKNEKLLVREKSVKENHQVESTGTNETFNIMAPGYPIQGLECQSMATAGPNITGEPSSILSLLNVKTENKTYTGPYRDKFGKYSWYIQTSSVDLTDDVSILTIYGTIKLNAHNNCPPVFHMLKTEDEPRFARILGVINKAAQTVGDAPENKVSYYYDRTGLHLNPKLTNHKVFDQNFHFHDTLVLSRI